MAKQKRSALEQNELDQIEQLDLVDEAIKDIRLAHTRAECEKLRGELIEAIDALIELKAEYHTLMQAEARARIDAAQAANPPQAVNPHDELAVLKPF